MGQSPDLASILCSYSRDQGITRVFRYLLFWIPPLNIQHNCSRTATMALTGVSNGLSYPNVLALSALIFATYIVITAVYRLYFHPLAKFPGPFWAKLTTFPVWWHSKKQDRHLWLLNLQEQYGKHLPRVHVLVRALITCYRT